jgi:hypothetical protein
MLLLSLLILQSCAERDAPTPATVQKVLESFYESQGFKIVSLDFGEIEGAPLAQKTYGKKRAFYVNVKRLVLEGQGRRVARENGMFTIRQQRGAANIWEIERIPPELAP